MTLGLAEKWDHVIGVLEDIIPVYDRVNSYISLGKDSEYRTRGIRGRVNTGYKVLDAGSGFGNMSKTASSMYDNLSITLYDPLLPMLRQTSRELPVRHKANGVFEHMPFQNEMFDTVLCGYSLRDAINLRVAISELYRVTKKGGCLVVVDLGKPDNSMIRAGVSFYLCAILPLLALVAGGRLGWKFATLYDTYKRWPHNKKLESLLLEKYSDVYIQKGMLGGAIMVAARKT